MNWVGDDDHVTVIVCAGKGAAMIIESLSLFYHLPCFKCYVCSVSLGSGISGADVRVRSGKLHCHACYSNDEGEVERILLKHA